MTRYLRRAWVLALVACWSVAAPAQTLPVTVDVAGSVATIRVGSAATPLADITLVFDQPQGLTPASLGVSAQLVDINSVALLSRLPSLTLTKPKSALPLLVTIEPPSGGGLVQRRLTHIDLHTHALSYTAGSSLRLFKAQIGGPFHDITSEIAPGSVRTRGTTPGWSQFIVIADTRPTGDVIEEKYATLRDQVALLPAAERPPLTALLDASEDRLGDGDFARAISYLDSFRARVSNRSGTYIPDTWRATRDVTNHAGALLSGADTLGFSIGFLRDFGH